ncbi:uncharacterized protein LOC132039127 [Lycium ferocissimum]|uniref:uncharacterized protein LOC132039127 n=1 Tax=Lycium ferocissimum TaxID=112874 RepID=UPI00281592FA|nr:uncharacterized protein LOC132039127 [Lycium ferocissimum]
MSQNYQGGYQNQNQWRPQQGQGAYKNNNSGNYNNNYGGMNQGSYNIGNNFRNKSSNPYIPPKGQSTEQGSSRVEAMLEKVLANQSKSERTLSGLIDTVGSHIAAIQKLESQMRDISREQHPPKKGGLFQIQRTKEAEEEEEEEQSEAPIIVDENLTDKKVADIPKIVKEADDTSKQTVKRALRPLTQLFKPKPPFPQKLVKKKEDAKFEKFYDQLKQLSLNFPFLEAVKEMPNFAKYLKDLLTKKKAVQHETVSFTHTMSSIISTTTVQKNGDPGAFTIPCFVGHYDFARALCDNWASITLMPLAIYKQSGIGMPRPITMKLQMADRSIKRPVGVVDDVFMRVGEFMLPADFVILDCAVDRHIPIILERPFLATERALMDSEKNEIKFRVNDDEVTFQASKGMKLPSAYKSILVIDSFDVVDEAMEFEMEEESLGKALADILVNFDAEDMEGYMETVNLLVGLGSYSYHPKKLNLDLENRTTPLAKPSIIEPPKLELKQLPSNLNKWVSPVQCVPKKGGITVVPNEKNELIPTRTVTGWRVCMDYRKLNTATCKDHFPMPFIDQILDRLAGRS